MSVSVQPEVSGDVIVHRRRRGVELFLLLLAQALPFGGWIMAHLGHAGVVPDEWPVAAALWFGTGLAAHLVVRWRLPYADPVILPVVFLLNGLGLAMIARIDLIPDPPRDDAFMQLVWTMLGVGVFVAVAVALRDHRRLQRYPYLLFLAALVLLLLPLTPLGAEINGARIWIRVAGFSFQPAEIAKIALAIAFAAYFYEKRDVLALAGNKVLGVMVPRARDFIPILVMWVMALMVMVFQNDLGMALLIFGLFTVMIYVATQRMFWPVLAFLLFLVAGVAAYRFTAHVPRRVQNWLDPFGDLDRNWQLIQGLFGMAWGGLFGRGWGEGRPGLTPLSKSDFIAAAMGEEIGIIGLMGIVVLYAVLISRGLKAALVCPDGFGKLLAGGLAFVLALQVFAIIGGVTMLLPLTGLTTPFMSQGGSALVANWLLVALLMLVSHRARMPQAATATPQPVDQMAEESTELIAS
ncbi:FtsW/RodA/SpoVE family cell cycle protein [uncultured Tessaracoccus sp.]|uniref:FtsW/RodA/SpoVE family cell cycle protein n=1 Tax=uncultured Tessaracoccus sp. TaxID=905023 RepID=UPI0025EAD10C|nr:FtsW/RodA/SpoVE family cell cycle protein [uncultured Tessaracoccus sp.]